LDGATTLGTGTLSAGKATLLVSSLTVGSHTLTAVYSGDTNFAGNTSAAITQTVNKATTTTALVSSVNPSTTGQTVTFTATVSPQSGGTPPGTVTFRDGATNLATIAMSGGKASFTTSSLTRGTHTISAVYSGDTNFNGSTSANLLQTVGSSTAINQQAGLTVIPQSTSGSTQTLEPATDSTLVAAGYSTGGTFVSTASPTVSPTKTSDTSLLDAYFASVGGDPLLLGSTL